MLKRLQLRLNEKGGLTHLPITLQVAVAVA